MVNVLYWPIILGSLYTGFKHYPLWWVLILGAGATIAFFIAKPDYAAMAFRERGLSYVLFMVAASSLPMALFFGIGWLVGDAFSN
jgi:hypothetical protein